MSYVSNFHQEVRIAELERERDQLRAELAAIRGQEPVAVTAVAVTYSNANDDLRLRWLLEGGIAELEMPGQVLLVADAQITDDEGHGEVYLLPPQQPDAVSVPSELEALKRDAERYRWLCEKFGVTKLPCAIERILDGDVYVPDGKNGIDAAIDAAMKEVALSTRQAEEGE